MSTPVKTQETEKSTPTLTYGQRLVGLSFNPSGLPEVNEVKQHYADVIDRLHGQRDLAVYRQLDDEKLRTISIAIEHAQTAQMWAVKALTM